MNTLELAQALAARPPHEAAVLIENVFDQFRAIVTPVSQQIYKAELELRGFAMEAACAKPQAPPPPPAPILVNE